MKIKFDNIIAKNKWKLNWTKYLIGVYLFDFTNRKNKKINSKFLSVFCFLAIIFFVLSMIFSAFALLNYAYHKYDTLTITGVGFVIPSLEADSIAEIREIREEIEEGVITEQQDIKRMDFLFVPFFLYIPIIFIISSIHEFGHYIACRKFGLKVNSYGFGIVSLFCIPVIPIGYVMPNEKKLEKAERYEYLSIVSSGIFMNILGGIVFLMLIFLFGGKFFDYLFTFNLGILMLNVLPLGFLDGGLFIRKINIKLQYLTTILSILLIIFVVK